MKLFILLILSLASTISKAQNWEWSRRIPHDDITLVKVVNTSDDHAVIHVSGNNSDHILKYDPNGDLVWDVDIPKQSKDFAVDQSGQVTVIGFFNDTLNFNGNIFPAEGQNDIFMLSLSSNGQSLWMKHFGSLQNEYATTVTTDNTGNIYIAGVFTDSIIFGSISSVYPGTNVFIASFQKLNGDANSMHHIGKLSYPGPIKLQDLIINNGYFLTGVFDNQYLKFNNDSVGNHYYEGNVFALRGNASLDSVESFWQEDYQCNLINSIRTPDDNYYTNKHFQNQYGYSYSILPLFNSQTSTTLYSVSFPGAGPNSYHHLNSAIKSDPSSSILLGGVYYRYQYQELAYHEGVVIDSISYSGNFIIKHSSSGTMLWKKVFSNVGPFQFTNSNNQFLYVAGEFSSWLILHDTLIETSSSDIFIARLSEPSPLKVENIETDNLSFYPNPAKEEITVTNASGNLMISDGLGRIVYRQTIKSELPHNINLSHLNNGMYYLILNGEKGIFQNKLLIRKD